MSESLYIRAGERPAVHPGRILRRELEARGMPQAELARLMGCPLGVVTGIAQERQGVSEETAVGLEGALGVPAHVWVNLQSNHDRSIGRLGVGEGVDVEAD